MSDSKDNSEIVGICSGNIGQVDNGTRVIEKRNTDGTLYFEASTRITHIFGSECEAAPLYGYGPTKEIAIERLEVALKKFNDSLWAE